MCLNYDSNFRVEKLERLVNSSFQTFYRRFESTTAQICFILNACHSIHSHRKNSIFFCKKAPNRPNPASTINFLSLAPTFAGSATRRYFPPKPSLKPTVVGRLLTRSFRALCAGWWMQMVCAQKSNAPTAGATLDMSFKEKSLRPKTRGTV